MYCTCSSWPLLLLQTAQCASSETPYCQEAFWKWRNASSLSLLIEKPSHLHLKSESSATLLPPALFNTAKERNFACSGTSDCLRSLAPRIILVFVSSSLLCVARTGVCSWAYSCLDSFVNLCGEIIQRFLQPFCFTRLTSIVRENNWCWSFCMCNL